MPEHGILPGERENMHIALQFGEGGAEMCGNIGKAAMELSLLILRVEVEEWSWFGQCAKPVPAQCVRDAKLHDENAFANGSLAGDEGYVAQGKAILHGPFAQRRLLPRPCVDTAEGERHIGGLVVDAVPPKIVRC